MLIRGVEQLPLTDLVEPPVVVKPNLQGSSIGIGQQSLCHDSDQAKTLAASLLARFAEPVLVERFIEGLEITVAIWGSGRDILLFQAIEIYEPTGRIDFKRTIWSYELKKQLNRLPKAQRSATLSTRENHIERVVVAMGKIEMCARRR